MIERGTDASGVERAICGLAAGPLPAHHRGTRRKYFRVGLQEAAGQRSGAVRAPRTRPARFATSPAG
ncbi:hypothetical protein XarbCFBP8147_09400 [Xanthomonas arboricola]|nr:hypothetical protein XarbCFBP8147_09400 [Xanthomonas arboricola]